ncbi:DUF6776 family protein [Bordetella avium]|uniref:Exported protein n=1 Tax=Bordetella avium (strain 197N) TaxID=360910 RepID=Q2KV07_BORA1|nr:DUF6776 family protein [Bordetella avium]RIQ19677.1 hypothetical protein D0850_00390 [Bordetella avium]RIQ34257.1 hypothetical protein D0849_06370 [Bordetella avium]RIQ55439.1 hypothetical protein D0843_00390 [Bordetella avium]RIQ73773.1 hypothetical protein D0838_00670 [Bordetella avium]CAJ50577.1 putative exported protein [Bordetella avium 197N]
MSQTSPPTWPRAAWIALVLVLAAGVLLGRFSAQKAELAEGQVLLTQAELDAQHALLKQREAEVRFVRAQLDTADGEIAVERAARQELEAQLRGEQAELGRVRDQLAFYEQLLPPGPAGSIDIRGAEFARAGDSLSYRILLMRSGRGETPFNGELRFQASGTLKGQAVTVDLLPKQVKTDEAAAPGAVLPAAAAEAIPESSANAAGGTGSHGAAAHGSAGLLALHFDQFQRSQGLLALPEGFVPETVTVTVLEGASVRASRKVQMEF